MKKFLSFVFIITSPIIFFSQTQEKIWRETTQKDFADGTFDGGGNLYASWKGDIQVVNSWDLNNDGYLDIVFSNYSTDSSYNIHSDIYWGSRAGFSLHNKTSLPTHACIAYNHADLDNDGFMDIVFGSWQSRKHDMNEYDPSQGIRFFGSYSLIYQGKPTGFEKFNFSELYTYAPTGVSIADINNDGYLDIIFASSSKEDSDKDEGEITIYLGNNKGYHKDRTIRFSSFRSMVASPADLNKDGYLDMIVTNLDDESHSSIYWGSRNGFTEENTTDLETSYVRSVAVADLNSDCFLDIIFANGKDKKSFKTDSFIYWGSERGYSKSRRTSLPTELCMQPAVADMNRDGYLDIVFANCGEGESYRELRFDINSYIYYGSEDGFLVTNRKELPTCGAHSVAIADYDDNGELDLVFSSTGDPKGKTVSYYSILYYQKDGEFTLSDVKFPTHDGHHNTNRDLGNIYDRKYRDAYVSSVLNAQKIVKWKKVEWDAVVPEGCAIKVFLQTFNGENNEAEWKEVRNGKTLIHVKDAQFCRYKIEFHYDGKRRPKLNEIRVYYAD